MTSQNKSHSSLVACDPLFINQNIGHSVQDRNQALCQTLSKWRWAWHTPRSQEHVFRRQTQEQMIHVQQLELCMGCWWREGEGQRPSTWGREARRPHVRTGSLVSGRGWEGRGPDLWKRRAWWRVAFPGKAVSCVTGGEARRAAGLARLVGDPESFPSECVRENWSLAARNRDPPWRAHTGVCPSTQRTPGGRCSTGLAALKSSPRFGSICLWPRCPWLSSLRSWWFRVAAAASAIASGLRKKAEGEKPEGTCRLPGSELPWCFTQDFCLTTFFKKVKVSC